VVQRRLTRWQRFVRFLWRFYGPAQVGPPPYATDEELRLHAAGNRPLPPPENDAPPGYRMVRYTDPNGVERHTLVRDERDQPPS
jgi:hypothetical protein